jgi:four helix bundle protein
MENKKYDLENRLVEYGCRMIDVVEALPSTRAGNYIAGQLIKCCLSPAFNYGEVQAAESRNDFIHKLGVVLKELKECRTAFKKISRKEMIKPVKRIGEILKRPKNLLLSLQRVLRQLRRIKQEGRLNEHRTLIIEN